MLYVEAKQPTHRITIGYMDAYAKEDSTGRRIKWARKRLGWKQEQLCDRVGIGIVYLSALENDKRSASRETMTRLADVLGVSRAFLEMETPDPAPMTTDPAEPNYFSPEADEVAQLVDAMSPELRAMTVDVVRILAMHDLEDDDPSRPGAGGVGRRLILGKLIGGLKKSAPAERPTSRINSE